MSKLQTVDIPLSDLQKIRAASSGILYQSKPKRDIREFYARVPTTDDCPGGLLFIASMTREQVGDGKSVYKKMETKGQTLIKQYLAEGDFRRDIDVTPLADAVGTQETAITAAHETSTNAYLFNGSTTLLQQLVEAAKRKNDELLQDEVRELLIGAAHHVREVTDELARFEEDQKAALDLSQSLERDLKKLRRANKTLQNQLAEQRPPLEQLLSGEKVTQIEQLEALRPGQLRYLQSLVNDVDERNQAQEHQKMAQLQELIASQGISKEMLARAMEGM